MDSCFRIPGFEAHGFETPIAARPLRRPHFSTAWRAADAVVPANEALPANGAPAMAAMPGRALAAVAGVPVDAADPAVDQLAGNTQ